MPTSVSAHLHAAPCAKPEHTLQLVSCIASEHRTHCALAQPSVAVAPTFSFKTRTQRRHNAATRTPHTDRSRPRTDQNKSLLQVSSDRRALHSAVPLLSAPPRVDKIHHAICTETIKMLACTDCPLLTITRRRRVFKSHHRCVATSHAQQQEMLGRVARATAQKIAK